MKKLFSYYEVKDAEPNALEQLLKQLPTVEKHPSRKDQLLLQLKITPFYFYLAFGVVTLACVGLTGSLEATQSTMAYVIVCGYMEMISLLLLPEIFRSKMARCEEIERTCRFHFIQILLYRLLLAVILLLIVSMFITWLSATAVSLAFSKMYLVLLLSLAATLWIVEVLVWICKFRSFQHILLAYLFTALLVTVGLVPYLIAWSTEMNLWMFGILLIGVWYFARKLWKEEQWNETFSFASE